MLALELPRGEFLVPGILFLLIGLGLLTLARVWPAAAVEPPTPSPPTNGEVTGPVIAPARVIDWPALIDADAGELSEDERKRVIDGLAIVGDDWCAQILAKAFDQEDDALRVAAIEALGHCNGDLVVATLDRAYASYALAERYAAIDGAARRGDITLLERALGDTDGTVALAAAYGLHRAERDDLIDANLTDRNDARANEIRRLLPMLALK